VVVVCRLHNVPETARAGSVEERSPSGKEGMWSGTGAGGEHGGEETKLLTDEQLSELSFTELRDVLIAVDPLNRQHIVNINNAEAEYWKRSEGYRVGWSDEILGFDCGGQQWVSEVSFPAGTLKKPDMKDINYMAEVLKMIRDKGIPAPAPLEQRWSASSRSPMSVASSSSPDTLNSWVRTLFFFCAWKLGFGLVL
jgi:L-galactono-1,4-lactone dehydrogenase